MKSEKKVIDEVAFINMDAASGKMLWIKLFLRKKVKAIIPLNPLPSLSDSLLMNTIAHEIAHFILNHERFLKHRNKVEIMEREADDLAVKWGFKRAYKSYRPLRHY